MASNVGQGSGSAPVLILLSTRHRHRPVPLLRGKAPYLQPPLYRYSDGKWSLPRYISGRAINATQEGNTTMRPRE
ncbi:hypothetical protein CAJAP_07324 [Camponotus japonicus]